MSHVGGEGSVEGGGGGYCGMTSRGPCMDVYYQCYYGADVVNAEPHMKRNLRRSESSLAGV